jgi:hypothetical protein
MSRLQTEGRDQAVDGFAHSMASPPQVAVVPGRGDRQIFSAAIKDLKVKQNFADLIERGRIPNSLQHFAKNQIS